MGNIEKHVFLLEDDLPFNALITPKFDNKITKNRVMRKNEMIKVLKEKSKC